VEEAAERMAAIRHQLKGVDLDLIYNVDETGLLYRGLRSNSYVPSEDRRMARGSKAIKSKDCVTLMLCCNATGSLKLPVTMMDKAVQPLCFTGEENECPLPYLSQKSAWTAASRFKRWFDEVFVPAVQGRKWHQVYLIMDNLGCHSSIANPKVTIIELTPNTTAVIHPLDAGIIATLKLQYKKRPLYRVVCNLDALVSSGASNPCVPRGWGLECGEHAHLLDAANFILEKWKEMPSQQILRCWLKADCLSSEANTDFRRYLGEDGQPVADNDHVDVSSLVAMIANTTLEHEFEGVRGQDQAQAVRRWLVAETDVEAMYQTVDMVLAGADDRGRKGMGG